MLIAVDSPGKVELISAISGDDLERDVLIRAEIDKELKKFPFGEFLSQKKFAIAFRSLFVKKEGDDFDYVLSYASKLSTATTVNMEDDGITQGVQVKKGSSGHLKENAALKPIVKLSPYRTFREVEQPESEFLLRVRAADNDAPMVALFEADGGAYALQATENIVQYIQSMVVDIPVIA
jgi:hypothetical protein